MSDPHGIVKTFRDHYEANLPIMRPDAAARQAMAALDGYLKASEFVNVASKSTVGPQYIRVDATDKRPKEVRR